MVTILKMTFVDNILHGVDKQKIYTEPPNIEDIAVNISLINGDILPFCFITSEDEKYLNIVSTDLTSGAEKVNVICKEAIVKIAVCYADDLVVKEVKKEKIEDKMII